MPLNAVPRHIRVLTAALAGLFLLTPHINHARSPSATTQLLAQGGMEEPGGWHGISSGSPTLPKVIERTRSEKVSGDYSLWVVISRKQGKSWTEWPGLRSASIRTETGKSYRIRFWAKVVKGGVSVRMQNGADSGSDPITSGYIDNDEWREYVGTYHERAGGSNAYLVFSAAQGDAQFYLDDVSIEPLDVTVENTLEGWRSRFPDHNYVCWRKPSPWDGLDRLHTLPDEIGRCGDIHLDLGRNEYESTSFVLTNLLDRPLEFAIAREAGPLSVTLRKAAWATAPSGHQANDALSLIDDGLMAIPPGESREIWVTLFGNDVAAGRYSERILLSPRGFEPRTVEVDLTVYDVKLPARMPLKTYYWDYVFGARDETEAFIEGSMADLRSHYTNVATMHPACSPPFTVGPDGQLIEDYGYLDQALDAYSALDPEIYLFFWNTEGYLEPSEAGRPEFMSAEWKRLFRQWLAGFVTHLQGRGITYDRFVMNPYDERLDEPVRAMAELIKDIDPRIRIFVNLMVSATAEEIANIAPYVDVWCPLLQDYLEIPPYDREEGDRGYDSKQAARRLLMGDDRWFWTYTMPIDDLQLLSPPYDDYRLAVWRAWKGGMTGFGFWTYNYNTTWSGDGRQYAVVYRAEDENRPSGVSTREPVIPGKRWEATREGLEDYAYLHMLRQAIASCSVATCPEDFREAEKLLAFWPTEVLRRNDEPWLADEAKARVIEEIVRLSLRSTSRSLPRYMKSGVDSR